MKTLIVLLATVATLVGCSKPAEQNTARTAVVDDQDDPVSHAKQDRPNQAKKSATPAWDTEIQRGKESVARNPHQYDWGKL